MDYILGRPIEFFPPLCYGAHPLFEIGYNYDLEHYGFILASTMCIDKYLEYYDN